MDNTGDDRVDDTADDTGDDGRVRGGVAEGYAAVRDVFAGVVDQQPGTGAALAVWHDGDWVVDLHGGWADAAHTRPWTADTLVMPYSVTKPFAAVCVLLLADRGLLALDVAVQEYWPGLRAPTTLRQILSHRAGLVVLDEPAPEEAFYDWDLMVRLLEVQRPQWEPGTAAGESALFYGHLLGEVVRRVDGRSLGAFLREEVCAPHGLDFHVGLSTDDLGRVADLTGFDLPAGERTALYEPALANPPGALDPRVVNGERWRRAEVPAVNGHGTARAVAGLYVALERGGLLSPGLLAQVKQIAGAGPELVVGGDARWGLGVGVEPADGYGMGGLGGSFGWWSEAGGYAIAFLTGHVGDYARGERLENVVRRVLDLPPV